jgi:hypothetical protein
MAEQEKQFRIRVRADADLQGLNQATEAQKTLNAELKKSRDIQAAPDAETNGAGTQALNAQRASIEAKLAAYEASKGGGAGDLGDTAKQMEAVATSAPAAAEGSKALGLALGAVGTLAAAGGLALKSWINDNERLKTSFDNALDAAGKFVTGGIDQLLGRGDALKSFFDGVTVALGGQTEAMKNALAPMSEYIGLGEKVLNPAEQMAKNIQQQKDGLKEQNEELAHSTALKDKDLQIEAELMQAEMDRREAAVQASDMEPEDKATDIEALRSERRVRQEEINARDRFLQEEQQTGQVQNAWGAVGSAVDAEMAQEERVKALDAVTRARAQVTLAKSMDEQFNGPLGRMSDTAYDVASALPGYMGPGISPSESAERLRQAREAEEAAREKLPFGATTSKAEEERKALDAARERTREAASQAVDVGQGYQRGNELSERDQLLQEIQAMKEAASRQAAGVVEGVTNMAGHLITTQSAMNQALQGANSQLAGLSAEVNGMGSGMAGLTDAQRRARRDGQRFYY